MTTRTTIENPVINSPFDEPRRHFQFNVEGITGAIVQERRKSVYFVPVPKPKTSGKTADLFAEPPRPLKTCLHIACHQQLMEYEANFP